MVRTRSLLRISLLFAALAAVTVTTAPSFAQTKVAKPKKHFVVGYFGDWQGDIGDVQFNHLSALIYAFADESGDSCVLDDGSRDASADFPIIKQMKHKYHNLKVLLSLGGGTYAAEFPFAVSTPAKIHLLVSNCMNTINNTYPGVFDGIDINWGAPTNGQQELAYTKLVYAFRHALGKNRPLSVAATPRYLINWKAVVPKVNWINLMTYDYHQPSGDLVNYDYHQPTGDTITDFLAPLRANPSDPQFRHGYSVEGDLHNMIASKHVPSRKILMGIPFFGLGYSGVKRRGHGLYQTYWSRTNFGSLAPGDFNYRDLILHYTWKKGYRKYGPDPYSKEVWLYKPAKQGQGIFISYDGVKTVISKAKYAKSLNLGGTMIWTVAADTKNKKNSLTRALYRQLRPLKY